MLPKSRRLVAAEVREVLRKGRSNRATFLSFKCISGPEFLRVAVVVPKSVAKKATERNRIRRAVYRALSPLSGTGLGVVFVQKTLPQPIVQTLKSELSLLLKTQK
jgi:ribonuclease P protein component